MLLLIDNFDSFTYNLVQVLGHLGADIQVARNDAITVEGVREIDPDHILISPGPCTPKEAGVSLDIIEQCAGEYPILGVCLGCQAIGSVYGADVIKAPEPMHGKTGRMAHINEGVFSGMPQKFIAARYHSLIIDEQSVPEVLEVTAWCDNLVMGIRHRRHPYLEGVQFHPESFLTERGEKILSNFMSYKLKAE